jgi:hypothetical protein
MYRETKRETQRETQLKTQRETQLETQLKTQRETQLETQLGTQQETQRNRNTTGTFRHVAFLLLCVLPSILGCFPVAFPLSLPCVPLTSGFPLIVFLLRCVPFKLRSLALHSPCVAFPLRCVPLRALLNRKHNCNTTERNRTAHVKRNAMTHGDATQLQRNVTIAQRNAQRTEGVQRNATETQQKRSGNAKRKLNENAT